MRTDIHCTAKMELGVNISVIMCYNDFHRAVDVLCRWYGQEEECDDHSGGKLDV